ncbi:calcium/proton exchanger [Martensiomyces pterosporus]|nr:calcium/proton exchanger [Martensiomyces pterosporus]
MARISGFLQKTQPAKNQTSSQAPAMLGPGPASPPAPRQSLSNRDWGLNAHSTLVRASRSTYVRTSTVYATAPPGDAAPALPAANTAGGRSAAGGQAMQPAGLAQPVLILRRALFSSWLNVLLLLVPVGIASHPAKFPDVAVFIINFFAIVPLAKILGYATEQLALHLGETMGGLLNATFGNAVELLVGILALVKGEIEIVQTSLVGSILSNLLLVGGCCFFFGGLKNNEQLFNVNAAQSYGSLLAMAILSTLLPAAYNSLHAKETELKSGILTLSHVTSIFLLIVYVAYLVFQLKTHANLFEAVGKAERESAAKKPSLRTAATPRAGTSRATLDSIDPSPDAGEADVRGGAPSSSGTAPTPAGGDGLDAAGALQEEEEEEEVELTVGAALLLLLVVTGLTGVCAEFLVDSIDGLTTKWNLSRSFVGMILLPIVGNAAEHVTAITVAMRNKMDLAIGVSVGSSLQIALFVTPFLCVLGWIIKQPMTIFFSPFTTVVMFVTVILVNYIIGDGRTNWLEGLVLIVAYIIIGVAYFLYPKSMDGIQ